MENTKKRNHFSPAAAGLYRKRKRAIAALRAAVQEDTVMREGAAGRTKAQSRLLEDRLWHTLVLLQGYPFYTTKKLRFTYTIKGNEMFVSRKDKSITRATVRIAFFKALELREAATGPKKLGTFGASYLYPVFGIIFLKVKKRN